ncbi:MAG: helix-turn-helix domain-containing protein [Dysgonamonadaceae bacterium]|jgi:AraC-like DNA-binding protein|nr:helix-turn-helix domain-containing protein [Dysgonamonadaceae bacterium]
MENIFKIRELNGIRKGQVDVNTAFTFYEMKAGEELRNRELPSNYILFVLGGMMNVSCNQFEKRLFQANEMIFLLRSSSVKVKALKKTKLFVMYFDKFLSSYDWRLFKAYLPDVGKTVYDFRPVMIPEAMRVFLEQILYFQKQKIDCEQFNNLKHSEFFMLLRYLCPHEDIVSLLSPLIGNSMDFRNRVLESYPKLEGGSMTDFAGLVGMGRKTFDKRFREEFSISPAKWVQEETAKRLRLYFAEPDVTISDAMDKFHFNSSSHFNRFCRHYFHGSPGAIMKEEKILMRKKSRS